MKNKVLIKVYVTSIDENYEIYIPTNETIDKLLQLLIKSIYELSDSNFDKDLSYHLLDPDTGAFYINTTIIRDTNIKNSKKLVLI